MSAYRSAFLRTLDVRGFLHQATDGAALDARAVEKPIVAYIGFDCTADSLHVGSLLPIMTLRWLQKTGHKPVVLLGGATTMIGDPTGKDEARKALDDQTIARNMAGIRQVFDTYLTFGDGPSDAVMVNNLDWLGGFHYIGFLRDYGRHFSVNRMLGFDSVKTRLEREQPLSFLEFNYMILQAYDFLELSRREGCALQMGGSDQWGNIVAGVELTRRVDAREVYGLTTPLLTTASGAKMGKTAEGAVWLNADRLKPYDYWQFWRNTEDGDVGRFLKLFTELPLDEIARLDALEGQERNAAKIALATAATAMLHGEAAAQEAAGAAASVFASSTGWDDAPADDPRWESMPSAEVSADDLAAGLPFFDALRRAGLCKSGGEARKLIQGGGAKINDVKITDEHHKITAADIRSHGRIVLSSGKKKHAVLKPL